jgi:hypothetical protein
MEEMISEMIDKIRDRKEKILFKRCKELNLPIPKIGSLDSRFNPYLLEEHKGFGQLYYYNDGTKNGKFITGFTEIKLPNFFDFDIDTKFEFSFNEITKEPDWNKKT